MVKWGRRVDSGIDDVQVCRKVNGDSIIKDTIEEQKVCAEQEIL